MGRVNEMSAQTYFTVQALVSATATVLLVFHMNIKWKTIATWGAAAPLSDPVVVCDADYFLGSGPFAL
jgi:hypothetical protein